MYNLYPIWWLESTIAIDEQSGMSTSVQHVEQHAAVVRGSCSGVHVALKRPCKSLPHRLFIWWVGAGAGTNGRLRLRRKVLAFLPFANDRRCNCFPACEDGPPEDLPGRNPVFGALIKYWRLAESAGLQREDRRGCGFHTEWFSCPARCFFFSFCAS